MGKRVLVVEPSRTIRTLLEISLQQQGHQVVLFAGYQKARDALTLPAFRTYPPEIIFVALHTSQPESHDLVEELRQLSAQTFTRIIAMVAQEEQDHPQVRRLVRDQQVLLLGKPFRIQEALALVSASPYALPGAIEMS